MTAVVAAVLAFAAWLVWGGALGSPVALDARNTAFRILSDAEVEISWQLTVTPGTATSCALQSLNESYGVVGWKIVDLAPADQLTRAFTETIRTSERGVSGLIYRCWLT